MSPSFAAEPSELYKGRKTMAFTGTMTSSQGLSFASICLITVYFVLKTNGLKCIYLRSNYLPNMPSLWFKIKGQGNFFARGFLIAHVVFNWMRGDDDSLSLLHAENPSIDFADALHEMTFIRCRWFSLARLPHTPITDVCGVGNSNRPCQEYCFVSSFLFLEVGNLLSSSLPRASSSYRQTKSSPRSEEHIPCFVYF